MENSKENIRSKDSKEGLKDCYKLIIVSNWILGFNQQLIQLQ